jgi:hypothetical protein
MTKIFFPFTFLICLLDSCVIYAQGGKIILEGHYEGKNVYIQNPYSSSDTSVFKFCVRSVLVNGKKVGFEDASAFEINLLPMNFSLGDSVRIEILHSDNCKPKVLYNYDHHPRTTFEIVSISIDSLGLLKFTTKSEKGKMPFVIEQFRWNKWVKVGELEGIGGDKQNEYTFNVIPHSGENAVRVKQIDYKEQPRMSQAVKFKSVIKKVKLESTKVEKEIKFSAPSLFELYDVHGNMVKRGQADVVDCKGLKEGTYFLNYDNTTVEIVKQ